MVYQKVLQERKLREQSRYQTSKLIKQGLLIRPNKCDQCDKSLKIEAHHKNYNNPFDIAWLCRTCHRKHHRGKFFSTIIFENFCKDYKKQREKHLHDIQDFLTSWKKKNSQVKEKK